MPESLSILSFSAPLPIWNGEPVLFGYFFDLPRIARFNAALGLQEKGGTLVCFDFQCDVLRRYCNPAVRFQTIDFTKFNRRFFP